MLNIAIDGPSGAGKSTIAKAVAKTFGFVYIDTGAMYRTVGLAAIRNKLDTVADKEAIAALMDDIVIDIDYIDEMQHVFLNGEDVTSLIRTPEISLAASNVGVIMEVRKKMVAFQQTLAKKHNCIMDGRDIGTYVLPDADVKIFLTADVAARAKRRYDELIARGENVLYEDVLRDMEFRDKNDSSRECMPLKKAEDAYLIDTTLFDLETSIKTVEDYIRSRIA